MRGESIAARARALAGTRFRPQGRDPALGLDCAGAAAAAAGIPADRMRGDYPMRGNRIAQVQEDLCDLGLRPVAEVEAEAGDILLCEAGPAQIHLLVHTGTSFVHADAGLGRVVERPLPVPWPVIGVWRASEED
jgi:hypothetical protein